MFTQLLLLLYSIEVQQLKYQHCSSICISAQNQIVLMEKIARGRQLLVGFYYACLSPEVPTYDDDYDPEDIRNIHIII